MAGQKKRFEIFKRDGFVCQYCGRRPPTVELETDHIVPKAKGGDDDPVNLVTSCFDCNRGKGARLLEEAPPATEEVLRRRQEMQEQLTELNKFLTKEKRRNSRDVNQICKAWISRVVERNAKDYTMGPDALTSFRGFLKRIPKAEILDAIDVAHNKKPVRLGGNENDTWKYFCGVCWTKIKRWENGE